MHLKAFTKKAREYAKDFVQDESGMELLQLAIAVVITCGLIGAVVGIQSVIKNGLNDSADTVTSGFNEALGRRSWKRTFPEVFLMKTWQQAGSMDMKN